MNIKQFLEEGEKEFRESFVEMNILYGRDMHNRPPLYETENEDVDKIISWHKDQQKILVEKIVEIINKTQIELCEKFSNTPINERKSGWEWIKKYKEKLLESIK